MKRDMELIRTLMLRLEGLPMELGDALVITPQDAEMQVDGYSLAEINHHLDLIHEAGFIDDGNGSGPMFGFIFMGLTNHGHDFIDSVRSPEVWQKTTEVTKKVGSTSLSVVVDIAKAIGTELLKKAMGLS